MTEIRLKRIYEAPEPRDGKRYLVDRLWPRGISKERAALDGWAKEAAPSARLREAYCHDPAKWDEFRRLYLAELREGGEALTLLETLAIEGALTLVYAAREESLSHALILKEFIEGEIR